MHAWRGKVDEEKEGENREKICFSWVFFYYGCSETCFVVWQSLITADSKRIVGTGSLEVRVPLREYKTTP